jgi:hypothetical protein
LLVQTGWQEEEEKVVEEEVEVEVEGGRGGGVVGAGGKMSVRGGSGWVCSSG